MKLQIGKTYVTADGHEVTITGCDKDHPLPFIGDDNCGYRPDGGYLPLFGDRTPESERHEFDLIAETE